MGNIETRRWNTILRLYMPQIQVYKYTSDRWIYLNIYIARDLATSYSELVHFSSNAHRDKKHDWRRLKNLQSLYHA